MAKNMRVQPAVMYLKLSLCGSTNGQCYVMTWISFFLYSLPHWVVIVIFPQGIRAMSICHFNFEQNDREILQLCRTVDFFLQIRQLHTHLEARYFPRWFADPETAEISTSSGKTAP